MFRLSNLIKSTLENEKSRSLDGSIIIWNMTNRCNLLCHHCYSKASANEKETLALEDILNTIPKLKKAGVNFVIFSGGEPLLRKDIFEIAQCMKENKIMTYLSTNGTYITEKNAQKIIDTFNYIGISIDGSRDIGGDIGWFKKGDMIDEFWDASLKLKPQEFTKEPVKSMFGYHIIFLDEIQEPITKNLEQVYSNIENQIKMERFQAIIDERIKNIKKDANIIIK